jgi:hypothetical protein
VKFSANSSVLVNARDMFTSGSEALFCQACEQSVVTRQLFEVTQHLIGSTSIATIVNLNIWPGNTVCNW